METNVMPKGSAGEQMIVGAALAGLIVIGRWAWKLLTKGDEEQSVLNRPKEEKNEPNT